MPHEMILSYSNQIIKRKIKWKRQTWRQRDKYSILTCRMAGMTLLYWQHGYQSWPRPYPTFPMGTSGPCCDGICREPFFFFCMQVFRACLVPTGYLCFSKSSQLGNLHPIPTGYSTCVSLKSIQLCTLHSVPTGFNTCVSLSLYS